MNKDCNSHGLKHQLKLVGVLSVALALLGSAPLFAQAGGGPVSTVQLNTSLLNNTPSGSDAPEISLEQRTRRQVKSVRPGSQPPQSANRASGNKNSVTLDGDLTSQTGSSGHVVVTNGSGGSLIEAPSPINSLTSTGTGNSGESNGQIHQSGDDLGTPGPVERDITPPPTIALPPVTFGLLERRPDFSFYQPAQLFKASESYSTGQKGLGIGPGLTGNSMRYVPLGEF